MLFLVGLVIVVACVLGGYLMHHGVLAVLWQPNEFLIILGSAIGAFIIANPPAIISDTLKSFKLLFKSTPYKKSDYIELLAAMFAVFKLIKSKGLLQIEPHIENPNESALFQKYPLFVKNPDNMELFCSCLRLMTMGVDNPYALEDILDKELELVEHEKKLAIHSLAAVGDGMPALGIVAAVLGVIITMQSIDEPPTILGKLIGAALVGTFFGVLMSYAVIMPIAQNLDKYVGAEMEYLRCIKAGLIAHLSGTAPTVTIEFVRKLVPLHYRPTFKELEEVLSTVT